MAAHDWMLLAYHAVLLVLTFRARHVGLMPLGLVMVDLGWLVGVLALARGLNLDRRSLAVSALYRLTLVAIPIVSYLQLRTLLPALAPERVDGDILALDLRIFAYEPAIEWDQFVTTFRTEWFSLFYYSYFFLLGVHALPIALFERDGRLLREFAFGLLSLFCVGHLFYVVVPGEGPHAFIRTFANEIDGPIFWPLVRDAVANAGAKADIFPSLHTAVPTFLTIFAFHHRDRAPFKYTWPILAFFASQIILATMYLRWHWLADIFGGIALAITANLVSRPIASWEERRRANAVVGPAFAKPIELHRVLDAARSLVATGAQKN